MPTAPAVVDTLTVELITPLPEILIPVPAVGGLLSDTTPDDTLKSDELNDAIPFVLVDASGAPV